MHGDVLELCAQKFLAVPANMLGKSVQPLKAAHTLTAKTTFKTRIDGPHNLVDQSYHPKPRHTNGGAMVSAAVICRVVR